jgi:predicted XRE-type DNA-binding protein
MKTRTELVSQAKLLIAQANALQPNASTRLYVGKVSVTK